MTLEHRSVWSAPESMAESIIDGAMTPPSLREVLTRALLSLLSGLFLFKLPPGELALLRGVLRWVEGLHAAALANLEPGEVYCAFSEASDPRFCERARYLRLRPTATWAGGETVTVL